MIKVVFATEFEKFLTHSYARSVVNVANELCGDLIA